MSEWVTVARLGKPRGNRGELTAIPLSDHLERFTHLGRVYLAGREHQIEESWFHRNTLIFKFIGVDSIDDALALSGAEVTIPASERFTLDPGEFYQSDLIGCQVRRRFTKDLVGTVTAFEGAGSNGLLVIEGGILIPFTKSICVDIAPERREILVDLPEGLLDLNQ